MRGRGELGTHRNSPAQSSEQRRSHASRGQPGGVKAKLTGGKWSRGGGSYSPRLDRKRSSHKCQLISRYQCCNGQRRRSCAESGGRRRRRGRGPLVSEINRGGVGSSCQ